MSTTADTLDTLDQVVMHRREAQWRAIEAVGRAVDHLCITRAGKGTTTTEADELAAHAVVQARKQDMARADAAVEEALRARHAALPLAAQRLLSVYMMATETTQTTAR